MNNLELFLSNPKPVHKRYTKLPWLLQKLCNTFAQDLLYGIITECWDADWDTCDYDLLADR